MSRSRWFWVGILFVLATLQLLHRTPPVRNDSFFFDFSNVYSASRAWLFGHDAYRMSAVYATWQASGHGPYLGTADAAGMHTWAAVYPPSSLLMFAPFAAFTAIPAHALWMAFNLLLLGLTFPALFSLAKIRTWDLRFLLIACTLASAPVQCALGSGQPALPASALLILAVWAYSRNHITLSGVLLGLATAIKVQIGGPFILYYLFLRQWRLSSCASVLFLSITLLAITRLEAAGVNDWATSWHQNISATLEPGQINDPRPNGPFRNDMVNLQTLVDVPLHSELAIDLVVLMLFLPMVTGFFGLVRPSPAAGSDLLKLSIVGLLGMLPLYHRLYDGILLMMLLAWALSRLNGRQRSLSIIALALLAELLVPIDLIPAIVRRTHVFDSALTSEWWQGLIVPHHAWAILILTIGSLYLLWRAHEAAAVSAPLAPAAPAGLPTPTHFGTANLTTTNLSATNLSTPTLSAPTPPASQAV